MFLVDGLDGALEAAEEGLGGAKSALEVDCAGEFVDWTALAQRLLLPISNQMNFNIPYFNTSSKCFKCSMITSRCFSSIAKAINKWKLLLR